MKSPMDMVQMEPHMLFWDKVTQTTCLEGNQGEYGSPRGKKQASGNSPSEPETENTGQELAPLIKQSPTPVLKVTMQVARLSMFSLFIFLLNKQPRELRIRRKSTQVRNSLPDRVFSG